MSRRHGASHSPASARIPRRAGPWLMPGSALLVAAAFAARLAPAW